MSNAYKQKEYELRSAIDNISSIPYVFENYVEETEYFIDSLLDDTKEINTLRNQLQQKENIIKEVRDLFYEKCRLKDSDGRYSFNEVDIDDFRNLLEKGE